MILKGYNRHLNKSHQVSLFLQHKRFLNPIELLLSLLRNLPRKVLIVYTIGY